MIVGLLMQNATCCSKDYYEDGKYYKVDCGLTEVPHNESRDVKGKDVKGK